MSKFPLSVPPVVAPLDPVDFSILDGSVWRVLAPALECSAPSLAPVLVAGSVADLQAGDVLLVPASGCWGAGPALAGVAPAEVRRWTLLEVQRAVPASGLGMCWSGSDSAPSLGRVWPGSVLLGCRSLFPFCWVELVGGAGLCAVAEVPVNFGRGVSSFVGVFDPADPVLRLAPAARRALSFWLEMRGEDACAVGGPLVPAAAPAGGAR